MVVRAAVAAGDTRTPLPRISSESEKGRILVAALCTSETRMNSLLRKMAWNGESSSNLYCQNALSGWASFAAAARFTFQFLLLILAGCHSALPAQAQVYAGVLGGVATLSGDARSLLSAGSTTFSAYDSKNGLAMELVFGRHFSDYFALQADYVWNRNTLTLSSGVFSNGTQNGYQETRRSSQQSVIADVLVYFRKRESRLRPYLSVGTGLVHLSSSEERLNQVLGAASPPARKFNADMMALHVPVGMDVNLGKGWAFRYTFSETLSKNPISDRLSPPGLHSLKNFQNLFGFVKRF